jgi:signal transduction histidine kinase
LRISIRAKLAASLSVPLIGLLSFSAVEVRGAASDAAEVRSETDLATAATGPAGIINRLQDERNWASVELTGVEDAYPVPVPGYEETRGVTDEAIRAFRDEVESKGGATLDTYREALRALDGLDDTRRDIDDFAAPRSLDNMPFSTEVYDRYSDLIHLLLDANSHIPVQVRDAELRQGTELASMATEQTDLMADVARQTTVAGMMSPNGIDTSEEITRIATLLSRFNANNEQIRNVSDPYAAIVREDFPQDLAEALNQNVERAIGTRTIDNLEAFMDGATPTPGEGFYAVRDETIEALNDRADSLNARATTRQRLFTLLALGALVLAGTMTWLVARSITRPLRSLTRQAKDMAEHRLPTAVREILETPLGQDVAVPHVPPVAVKSRDEVTDVTAALNTVQESALDLAVEQAVLRRNIADSIVNLGRRNQNLLGRQLDFITELERNEADPDTLASLFRLDHLATRMRRNAESLLVLAGVEPPRTWAANVRMTDVIRAALGEVEDYQRVRVEAVEPAMVVGSATADLAHLLAELLENALTFSPPDAYVTVRGGWHSGTRFRLAVIDRGLGMAPAALDLANRRLAGAESFTVAPSRYLGHYVAGNLAARHGIGIRLEPGQAQGTVATVDLPPELVTVVEPLPAPEPHALAPPSTAELLAPASALATPASPPWASAVRATPPVQPPPARPARPTETVEPTETSLPPLPSRLPSRSVPPSPSVTPGPTVPPPAARDPLPRRVRGAHLPTLEPVPLHRPAGQRPAAPRAGQGPEGDRPKRPAPGASGPADDVYSFLSGFTAGVQRGLDETRDEEPDS